MSGIRRIYRGIYSQGVIKFVNPKPDDYYLFDMDFIEKGLVSRSGGFTMDCFEHLGLVLEIHYPDGRPEKRHIGEILTMTKARGQILLLLQIQI